MKLRILGTVLCLAALVALFAGCSAAGEGLGKIKVPLTTDTQTGAPKPTNSPSPTDEPTDTTAPPTPTTSTTNGTETGDVGALTADIFRAIRSRAYHIIFVWPNDESDEEEMIEVYKKDGLIAEVVNMGDAHYRTITKDNKKYVIHDDNKSMYLEWPPTDYDGYLFDTESLVFVKEDSENFHGKTYRYDEYEYTSHEPIGINISMQTRFYVEDGALVGIRFLYGGIPNGDDLLITLFDTDIPDSVFVIPDYEMAF